MMGAARKARNYDMKFQDVDARDVYTYCRVTGTKIRAGRRGVEIPGFVGVLFRITPWLTLHKNIPFLELRSFEK